MSSFNQFFNQANQAMTDVNRTMSGANRVVNQTATLTNALGVGSTQVQTNTAHAPMPRASSPAPAGVAQNPMVLTSQTEIVNGRRYYTVPAPKGTRLIIPQNISSTGQERYLGSHVLESIINMNSGNAKCANVFVCDAAGRPSPQVYDVAQNGDIFLKGTQNKINFDKDDPPVQLSEMEYASIIQSLKTQTNDVTYFKTTADRGNAENSTASSPGWFSRNWWKILLGLVIAGGLAWGGVALYNKHKDDKAKKAAQSLASSLTNTCENTAEKQAAETQTAAQTTAQGLSTAQNITNQTADQAIMTNNNSNTL